MDNTPALMALVKGSSGVFSLDEIARQFHLVNFALGAAHYYEYVQSASNWSDEISRLGARGPWAARRGFRIGRCEALPMMLALPTEATILVAKFL